jgi:integrase
MARKIRSAIIDNRSARLALVVRRKPHGFTTVAPGVALGFRRNRSINAWVVRCADGRGGAWTSTLPGVPDDFEDADGEHVLTFYQAQDKARQMARGQGNDHGRLPTWAEAIDDYETDLVARGGGKNNATTLRHHLQHAPALLNKLVPLLTAAELKRWRNELLTSSGLKPASVVRLLKNAKASLNLAANHDPRIQNRDAWRIGLGGLVDTYAPVDQIQPDAVVLQIVAEAYAYDEAFGLFVHVAAETAARASQIARLLVADLQADHAEPKLLMPSSRKGKSRSITRKPVPITPDLATRLKHVAGKRPPGDPLLLRSDGGPWQPTSRKHVRDPFAVIAERAGIAGETMYCLRHSAIVRALLAGVPARLVAANADTSLAMLERTYARFISHHGDDVARRGLLDTVQPANADVTTLPGRR